MQTALRETNEEAGLVNSDLKIYEDCKQEIQYKVKDKPKTVVYWLAELVDQNKSVKMSNEHQDFKWLPLLDACTLVDYKEMQGCLKFADKYISEKILQ